MIGNFYLFDCGFLFMLLIAAFVGYARGMTQQILGLGGWITAIILTIHAREPVTALGRKYIENPTLADIVSLAVLFILLLLIFISFSTFVGRVIKRSMIGSLDRSLGVLTGISIFYLSVSALYIVISFMIPQNKIPTEITHARSFAWIQSGAHGVLSVLPKNLVEAIPHSIRAPEELLADHKDSMANTLSQMKPTTPDKPAQENSGYSNTERKDMDTLFETLGEK